MKTLISATAAIAMLAGANTAFAAERETFAKEIHVGDLDLQTEEGQQTLDDRIRRVAIQECNVRQADTARAKAASRACMRETMTNGRVEMAKKIDATRYGG
ncbi:UrcA family protein [Croceicoccus naphthovorans]|uniref:Uncharacterized protein n=1 Tax=Croceicoccus naphthovorans TaxID=1348774 RepID=A0A0G3XKV6_9SPHN|nr:UrcA family protein [Croceicoccus naphthovorans]AKM11224.1 hypothetical protein AB433_16595 [Croceicoccus naphthovorans]MBB3989873.1 UrcA family protein [Croceicoccus naphthovorans]